MAFIQASWNRTLPAIPYIQLQASYAPTKMARIDMDGGRESEREREKEIENEREWVIGRGGVMCGCGSSACIWQEAIRSPMST